MGDQPQRVFLSYRRDDELAATVVGRLHDHLAERYGADNVFMDVDTIPPGVPFDDYLAEAVSQATVLIAVIGREWMDLLVSKEGGETDFVRIEIESALARGIPVVPLLVGDASLPQAADLPPALAPLSRHNSFRLDPGRDFKAHVTRLTDDLDRLVGHDPRTARPRKYGTGKKRGGILTLIAMMVLALAAGATFWITRPERGASPQIAEAGAEANPVPQAQAKPGTEAGVGTTNDQTPSSDPNAAPELSQQDAETAPKREEAPPAPRGEDETISSGIEMVWCPAGSFTMGSPDREAQRGPDEMRHEVQLDEPFWIARHELTQKQWQDIMGDNPSYAKDSGPDAPVEMVNWEDAMEFCQKLTKTEREEGRLPVGWHYTLPTEEQWEYACRAETETPFYFGASLNGTRANSAGNSPYGTDEAGPYLTRTIPVGSYEPNAWGIYDMHGNVSEWCLSIYERQYDLPAAARPVIPNPRAMRVYRGGSFHDYPSDCRSAHRFSSYTDFRQFYLGFRPVRTRVESERN